MSVSDEVTSSSKLLLAIGACLLVVGTISCSDPSGGGAGDGDEDVCQYECFADYRCEDGTVYEKQGGPIPCSEYGSEQEAAQLCADRQVNELRTCRDGCRTDIDNVDQFPSYTPELCAEDRLARPGDDCSVDADCRPSDIGVGPMVCESGSCFDPAAPEDTGVTEDAGDAGTNEDTGPEDTGTEDVEEDTETTDTADDSGAEDAEEDTAGDTEDAQDTQSGDAQDSSDSEDTDTADGGDASD
ncbi:MAG: hypothetical protein ACQEVA_20820 [Myxococcota bacterium]